MRDQSLDRIHGQPTTETMNTMDNQMAKICATVPSTAWGGRHGNLSLTLDRQSYRGATPDVKAIVDRLDPPAAVSAGLGLNATEQETKIARETFAINDIAYKTQEAVDKCGVEMIVAHMDAQYTAILDEGYVGFMTQTIKTTLAHVRTKWTKVSTTERAEARKQFHTPWANDQHIKMFALQIDRQQAIFQKNSHHYHRRFESPIFLLRKCSSDTCSGRRKFRTMK